MRGAPLRLLPERRAGPADCAGHRRWLQRSGQETLAALILGYDVAVRFGPAITPRPIAHQNGQSPLLGAVAAGARLRGLTGYQIARRCGSARSSSSPRLHQRRGLRHRPERGGRHEWIRRRPGAGAGAGRRGRQAERHRGGLRSPGRRRIYIRSPSTEELGERWEITRNYIRLRACCNPIYTALDALEDILADLGAIATVSRASRSRPTISPRSCASPSHSTLSPRSTRCPTLPLRWCYEAHWLHSFTDEVVRSAIAAFRRRVHVREDPDLSAQYDDSSRRASPSPQRRPPAHPPRESARGDFQAVQRRAAPREVPRLAGVVLSPPA